MPKSKIKRTKKSTRSWKMLFIYFIPVLIVVVVVLNHLSNGSVLGISDFSLNEDAKEVTQPIKSPKSCNRVVAFSASTICDRNSKEKSNNAFKTYSYACEDGSKDSLVVIQKIEKEKKCLSLEKAYELAKKACNKKCKPTKTPTPTPLIVHE